MDDADLVTFFNWYTFWFTPYQDSCNWQEVRSLPKDWGTWNPAKDGLAGTEVYGDSADDSLPWSVQFDTTPFNILMFTTGDLTRGMAIAKDTLFAKTPYAAE